MLSVSPQQLQAVNLNCLGIVVTLGIAMLEPFVGPSVASLSRYRAGGTHWDRGRNIENIIDTVHFARSHHSRMIQLADVFLFCMQFMQQDNTKGWRKGVADVISASGIQTCARVRVWPSEAQWYR
jgi:hypothetical protein